MEKRRNGWRTALLVLLLAFVGTLAFLRSHLAWELTCTQARRTLPQLLGLDVGIGRCEIDPLSATVRLYGVSAFTPGSDVPVVSADSAEVSLGSFQPFFGRLGIDSVRLVRPRASVDVSGPPSEKKRAQGCSLEGLSRVAVDRLEVSEGEVRVVLPKGQRVEVRGLDVRWKLRRGVAEFQLEAEKGLAQAVPGGPPLAVSKLYVEGGLDVGDERLELTRAELGLEDITVSVAGEVEHLCDPQLALDAQLFAPLRTVATAAQLQREVGGHLWARLSVSGRPREVIVGAEVKGTGLSLGEFSPGDFSARASFMGDELSIQELAVPAGPGVIRATGGVKLSKTLPVTLRFETENAEFARVLEKAGVRHAWVDFFASGKGSAQGTLLPLPNLAGEADMRVARFSVASRPFDAPIKLGSEILSFDQARVQVGLKVLPDRVELHGAKVDLPATAQASQTHVTGDVTLYYDPNRGLEILARPEALDLAHFGHISGIPWSGKGSGLVTIVGPYRDVRIDGMVSMRDFEFWKFSLGVVQGKVSLRDKTLSFPAVTGQKGNSQYFGQGALTFGEEVLTVGKVELARGGRLEDVVDLIAPMHSSIELFQGGTTTGLASGKVDIHGPAEHFAGTVALDVKDVTYYGRRLGAGRVALRFEDGQRMVLERTTLVGPLGASMLEGTFDFDGPLAYAFRGDDLSLPELVGLQDAQRLGVDGRLTLVGKVSGDSTTPVVKMYLTSPRVQFANKALGRMHLESEIEGRDLQLFGTLFDDARASARLRLKEPFPYEGTVALALPEIRPLLPTAAISQGVTGTLAGNVSGSGNLRDLRSLKAKGTVERLLISRGDFAAANDGPFVLTFEQGRLAVDSLKLRGPNTELAAAGMVGEDRVDLTAHGTLDVRLVESFVPTFERTAGRIELSAAASGTLAKPKLVGRAEIHDARFSIRDQPAAARNVSGRVEFSDTRVFIPSLEGVFNEGRVSLKGDVRLAEFKVEKVEVGLQVDEVNLRLTEQIPMTVSGELLLLGKPSALVLSGDVDLLKLRYEQPLELETLMLEAQRARYTGGGEAPKEWLSFDVAVHSRGDVRINNNLAKARLEGSVKLTGTNLRPGLLGTITAGEGSQAFFRGNQFAVSQGLLEFKDRKSVDAVFDLHAQTQVREYLVKLHGFGRLTQPQVIFTSEPELPEGDILSLLTLGVVSRDRSNTADTGAGLAAEALFKVSGFDRQVQRFLPKNEVLRDMQFHLSSTYVSAEGRVEPTAQLESKLLTEKLRLNLNYPLRSGLKGTKARAEYRFSDRLAGQLQWDNDSTSTSSVGNFGLDFKLRWEVE